MDVGTITSLAMQSTSYAQSAAASTKTTGTANAKDTAAAKADAAYDVDISEAAKKASSATKGLTSEQIDVLKQGIEKSQQLMISTLTEQNLKLQGWLDEGIGKLNFDGILFSADKFALPEVGTTPEEAEAAISDGGAYSIDAVATRIMDMATTIAGGDTAKLKSMQDAIAKGFEQAGITFKEATGESEMPEITQKTHDEITKRFDEIYKNLAGVNQTDSEM